MGRPTYISDAIFRKADSVPRKAGTFVAANGDLYFKYKTFILNAEIFTFFQRNVLSRIY